MVHTVCSTDSTTKRRDRYNSESLGRIQNAVFQEPKGPESLIRRNASPTPSTAIGRLREKLERGKVSAELETWNLKFEWAVVLARDIFLSQGWDV